MTKDKSETGGSLRFLNPYKYLPIRSFKNMNSSRMGSGKAERWHMRLLWRVLFPFHLSFSMIFHSRLIALQDIIL